LQGGIVFTQQQRRSKSIGLIMLAIIGLMTATYTLNLEMKGEQIYEVAPAAASPNSTAT
jgi:hypothetical protein